ncbi:quinone oxidoreductase family protein [Burkholderia ubonensis]|uniref:quinone oxidoreductase family protein n=1 Tax=Burkholderia ubonensis TaxID=101571 RepID=UPI0007585A24|nr:quinone oxidoreductase [Burkholderia ubonensis]KVZ92216.1 alcohol dehydrogenase [Burkholderia ubonensis]KWD50329.1 alcohol dehydrogenase [Burkholderia ubonensis]KWD66205.1 alcohol dehydrogenase [Burkholderia ubonensis]KWE15157.1 alcohol dehydrogenase [Burkholderia ubonensis]
MNVNVITACQIGIDRHGDADVLRRVEAPVAPPGPDEVRIRQTAVGVNFVDIYFRSGAHPLPALPGVLGVEAAGVIDAVGPGVTGLEPGQRVAYAGLPTGSYATARTLPAARVLPIPDGVSDDAAAAGLLKGITAYMLLHKVRTVGAGDSVLVHAAAGGVGLLVTQWASALGARVIGTVGSAAKAALVRACGAEAAVAYRDDDFVAAARAFGGCAGVDYAIDGIGGDVLTRTLGAVKPFGMVASIGQVAAVGARQTIDLDELGPARSIALARPSVLGFIARDVDGYREAARVTLERLAGGMHVEIGARLPLGQAADAHRMLEARATTGAVVLVP